MDIKDINEEFGGARLASASVDDGVLTLLFRTGDENEAGEDHHVFIANVDVATEVTTD